MKALIVNADDYGYSTSVNRGILRAHSNGIVTSTSIMVYGIGIPEDVKKLNSFPRLSKGLHFKIDGQELNNKIKNAKQINDHEIKTVTKQLKEQIDRFVLLFGKSPDHLDSHYSIHFHDQLFSIFKEISEFLSIPLRGFNGVNLITNFFKEVNEDSLIRILEHLPNEINELMCHPGIVDEHLLKNSSYIFEREKELKTLTSEKVKKFIQNSDIKLCTWSEYIKKISRL